MEKQTKEDGGSIFLWAFFTPTRPGKVKTNIIGLLIKLWLRSTSTLEMGPNFL